MHNSQFHGFPSGSAVGAAKTVAEAQSARLLWHQPKSTNSPCR